MIEENAVVVATEAGIAEVEIQRRSSCNACSARGGCGVSLLDRVLGRRPQHLLLPNKLGVGVGDEVVIGMPEGALLKAAVAAYMVPLLGLLAGGIIGEGFVVEPASSQLPPLFGGLAGLVLGLVATRLYSRRLAADPRWRAVLLRRAETRRLAVGLPSMR
jgi:sigma-E factor negative regulatory protein RseC